MFHHVQRLVTSCSLRPRKPCIRNASARVLLQNLHLGSMVQGARAYSATTDDDVGNLPPLVLVHGFFGGVIPFLDYFRGIDQRLLDLGHVVLKPELPPTSCIKVRAAKLLDDIHKWPERRDRRVIVLGHSMGGLDARYAIAKLGGDALIQTLLTISTPHRGSPIADLGVRVAKQLRLPPLLKSLPEGLLSNLPDGGECLTTEFAVEFNNEVRDSPDVTYLSAAGDRGSALRTSPELWGAYHWIYPREGPNDGAVSVRSARWGRYVRTVDLDHLHQMNFPLVHRWLSGAPSYSDVVLVYEQLADAASAESKEG